MTNPADTSTFIPMITLINYSQSMDVYQFSTDSMVLPAKYCLAFRSWGETFCSVDDISVSLVPSDTVWYSVTVNAVMCDGSDEELVGMVSGDGVYAEGSTVILEGVVQGCATSFIYWLSGVGDTIWDNPYSFVISSDVYITAVFGHFGGIDNPGRSDAATPLRIYPNPAVSTVTISGLKQGSRLTIIDINGRIVDDFETDSTEINYDVSSLSQGVYFIRSLTPSSTHLGKFIRK